MSTPRKKKKPVRPLNLKPIEKPLNLKPIEKALNALATLDDTDELIPFVDYCDDLLLEVVRLRQLLKKKDLEAL